MQELADWLDVEALPTFLLVHNFFLKSRVVGVDVDELRRSIDTTYTKIFKEISPK
jgi:hypothetical protein